MAVYPKTGQSGKSRTTTKPRTSERREDPAETSSPVQNKKFPRAGKKSPRKKTSKDKKEAETKRDSQTKRRRLLWYYSENREIKGPVTRNQLTKMYESGEINEESLVWSDGRKPEMNKKSCSEWTKASMVPEISEAGKDSKDKKRRTNAQKEKSPRKKSKRDKLEPETPAVVYPSSRDTDRTSSHSDPSNPAPNHKLPVGAKVLLATDGVATIRYAGTVHFAAGFFYGCELPSTNGDCDGSYLGQRYFLCDSNCGVFVRRAAVKKVLSRPGTVDEAIERGTIVETKIIAGRYKGKWVAASVHADNGDGTYNIEVLQSKKLMLTPLAVCVPRHLIRLPRKLKKKEVRKEKEPPPTSHPGPKAGELLTKEECRAHPQRPIFNHLAQKFCLAEGESVDLVSFLMAARDLGFDCSETTLTNIHANYRKKRRRKKSSLSPASSLCNLFALFGEVDQEKLQKVMFANQILMERSFRNAELEWEAFSQVSQDIVHSLDPDEVRKASHHALSKKRHLLERLHSPKVFNRNLSQNGAIGEPEPPDEKSKGRSTPRTPVTRTSSEEKVPAKPWEHGVKLDPPPSPQDREKRKSPSSPKPKRPKKRGRKSRGGSPLPTPKKSPSSEGPPRLEVDDQADKNLPQPVQTDTDVLERVKNQLRAFSKDIPRTPRSPMSATPAAFGVQPRDGMPGYHASVARRVEPQDDLLEPEDSEAHVSPRVASRSGKRGMRKRKSTRKDDTESTSPTSEGSRESKPRSSASRDERVKRHQTKTDGRDRDRRKKKRRRKKNHSVRRDPRRRSKEVGHSGLIEADRRRV